MGVVKSARILASLPYRLKIAVLIQRQKRQPASTLNEADLTKLFANQHGSGHV